MQITVNKTGHVTTVYDSFVMQSGATNGLDNSMLFGQMKSRATSSLSKVYTRLTPLNASAFYILTTPGRVLFNNLIYENLFL